MPAKPSQGSAVGNVETFSPGDLTSGIRKGDPNAVERIRLRVRRILEYKRLGIPTDAREDLEQEIMTQIWQAANRPAFDPDAGLWGFVELVTTRRCIDWLRSHKPAVSLDADVRDGRMSPLKDTLAGERTRLVLRALAALDGPCRELITLRVRDELTFREISVHLGKSEGSLRVRMYRCVRRLRKELDGLMGRRAESEGIES